MKAAQNLSLSICAALNAALVLFSTPALAVQLSTTGVGQVLLFPYYSAAEGPPPFATLLTITNTSRNVKALRVRVREGRTGESTAELNVYLAGYDSWTVAIGETESGQPGWGTFDGSCTRPALPKGTMVAFSEAAYADDPYDHSVERSREGSVDVLELGDYGLGSSAPDGSIASKIANIAYNPAGCAALGPDSGVEASAPTGGLTGSALVISVLGAVSQAYEAVALSNFTDRKGDWSLSAPTYSLESAHPAISVVRDGTGRMLRSTWSRGIDAVSATMMAASLNGEFVQDPSTHSETSWVFSMPTRWSYVRKGLAPMLPFRGPYASFGSCDVFHDPALTSTVYDREGGSFSICGMSSPPQRDDLALCFSTTVASFSSGVLLPSRYPSAKTHSASGSPAVAATLGASADNGWLDLMLHSDAVNHACSEPDIPQALDHHLVSGATTITNIDGTTTSVPSITYYGMPVIGLSLSNYVNGALDLGYGGPPLYSTYMSATPLRRSIGAK
ncbi:MAG: hypothetical protein JSR18_03690 [Proteobacteria bacterium]|nr:hypothetical protein [Pseudomonadota bacterium]